MKKPSNWLLFKQGLKGIFKFKIQFIIILILSFLSIFILTTSISLRDRLNNTYNQVVKNVDKFDYQYDDELFTNNPESNANKVSQNLMLMYTNDNSYSLINNKEQRFNLAFNKVYSGETFITKAFEDQRIKDLFKADSNVEPQSKEFTINVRNILMGHFYEALIKALKGEDTNSESIKNLLNTPIYAYAKTLNTEEIFKDNEYIQAESTTIDKGLDITKINSKNLFTFSYTAFTGVVAYIANVNILLNQAQNENSSITETAIKSAVTPELYEIITGNQQGHQSTNEGKYIVNEKNKYSLNVISNEPNNIIEIPSSDANSIIAAIKENGLKGISTPTFKIKDIDTLSNKMISISNFSLESNATNDDWSSRMTVFDNPSMPSWDFDNIYNNSSLNWILEGKNHSAYWDEYVRISQVLIFSYQMQLEIAASASNVKYELRKDLSVFDNVSQIEYKLVMLDDMKQSNLKILNPDKGGRLPLNKGEVLISEQFARARNIKLFSEIKIKSQNFIVTGYATDTFSYYPVVNDDLPVPQPKNSVIVYGSRDSLSVIKDNAPSGQAGSITKTFSRRFIWLNKDSNFDKFNILFTPSQKAKGFDESVYRYSWILQPQVVLVYSLFTIIVSMIIGIIALVGLIISLKKSIKANTKQIGILKALGVEPHNIALSYIAQSVIIAIFIIPLSWFIGLLVQSGFIHLFIPYFSIQLYQIQVSVLPLILGFVLFGVLSILISFFTAWRLTNKPVMEILWVEESRKKHSWLLNKLKNTVFNKSKFTLKFSITLASANRRNIYLMTVIIFITSFLVSIGFSIPAIVRTGGNAYYKNVDYSNSYNYLEPVSNSPLSKGAISYSKSPSEIDKDYVLHGNTLSYSNASNYFESTYDTSPISKYIYKGIRDDKPLYTNTFKYLVSDSANNKSSLGSEEGKTGLFQLIVEQFGNNFANGIGSQFSIGTIEQVLGLISNSLYDATSLDPLTGEMSKTYLTDAQSQQKYDVITKNLTQAIPLILSSILGSSGSSNGDWKAQILSVIVNSAPAFVQSYIQDPSRIQQYSFGFGVKKIFKDSETFATNIAVSNDKYKIKLTGLQQNQKAFNLEDKISDKLFVSSDLLEEINKVFNGQEIDHDIEYNDFKYYDKATNTLNVPILPNKQSLNTYKLSKEKTISDITTAQQQLLFEAKQKGQTSYDVLPKDAWVYNDNDFINSDYFANSWKDQQQKNQIKESRTGIYNTDSNYLNLYNLDNNKFTYKYLYNDDNSLVNDAYLFNDFAVKDNQGSSYIRPYYQYSNIELYLPKALLSQDQINGYDKWANYSKDNKNKNPDGYYNNNVSATDIPETAKKAWETMYGANVSESGYIRIKPYSYEYSITKEQAKNYGLGNIVDSSTGSWYLDSVRAGLLKQETTQVKYANRVLKINLEAVGNLDSYNGTTTLVDQGLANLIANYAVAKKYDVNYNFFEPEVEYKAGEKIKTPNGSIVSNYDKYLMHNDQNDLYVSDYTKMLNNGANSLNYTQMMWNNAKFSNISEPVDLTTGFLQTTYENNGLLLLAHEPIGNISFNEIVMGVANQKLLSIEKDLIAQISQLAISIAMLIIVSVIITSSLLIILIGDIYITHYQRFMILMKSFGYSNWKVQKYSFGTVTILSVLGWILATLLACGILGLIIVLLKFAGLAVPFIISWWPFVASLAVVAISYFGSLILISKKLRKGDPASLLMETNE
ncbi:ABC transporter permease [Mesoplasma melaleucae]|uniref:ABC transporter permease n=1 Tax=Mesoplasma melaleucae TaxID=81459 RepID=A0A2K8NYM2_9MOLU|nr:ABC transporter permease [Mesoplasma melaleucae]ATZ17841.1 ABC transporter permease [Mesoplasma melaleucae]